MAVDVQIEFFFGFLMDFQMYVDKNLYVLILSDKTSNQTRLLYRTAICFTRKYQNATFLQSYFVAHYILSHRKQEKIAKKKQ